MNPILLDLPMPILTPRLRLRPRRAGDGEVVNRAIVSSLEHLKPWLHFAQKTPTMEESEEQCRRSAARFILREDFTLSIHARDGDEFIGSTGLHRPNWAVPSFEIGYWIRREFEGRGYIAESVNALTRYAFQVLSAKRLEIRCDSLNLKSVSVMKRLGFRQEGVLKRDGASVSGELRDTVVAARHGVEGLPELDAAW
jgi:RimJ/RimL family protein N-acetyltransferase